ncbi:TonB-dependent receptor plug domain-containing protein [Tsuneonella sp. HG094]
MRVSTSLRLALFASTAAAGVVFAPAAVAQDVGAEGEEATPASDIVVTGTRIVRDGYQAPTPLTVLTEQEIQNGSPSNNIADFVNQLPALAGSTRPANSRLNISSGQAGINALNLRNFGETRTLILLDGRRSVASTITGVVDINTIPQMLVNRVDIVTGGASASYGSDAVAGVVNFILNKEFTGLKLEGDAGITTYGDDFNYSFSGAGGLSFADGRGHLIVSGELAHTDGVFNTNDREWNQRGYVRIQDPTWVNGSPNPQFITTQLQIGAANSTPGGLITGSAGGVANRLRGTYFGDGGQVLQYQYGALSFPLPANGAPSLTQGGSWRVNDSGRRIGLDPRDDRRGAFARLSFDVADNVTLFGEASYNWQEVYFNAGPNLSTGQTLSASGCGTAPTAASAPITCNAFLYNALGPAALAGITSVTLATTAADLPPRVINNKRSVQRYVLGAEGDFAAFGNEAHWDVYGQYGRAKLHEQLRNIMQTGPADNRNKLANATNVAFAQAGNPGGYAVGSIQCTINLDAITTNNDAACVPLNRLGIGVASAAAIDYVLGDPYRDEIVEQTVFGANLSLTPFATWAGDVSIAVGGEYRKEQIKGFVPTEFQPVFTRNAAGQIVPPPTNLWSVGNYLPSNGSFTVKEAYLEAAVPLGFGLDVNGAVRATDYSTSGYVTTWRLGATWSPIDDFRLRATRSRDIRAPNLNELFAAGSANSDSVRNPFYNATTGTASPLNGVSYNTATIGYSGFSAGNPNLRPEKADTWNVGGVITPRFLPGFSASADWFRIDMDGAIDSISAQSAVDLCFQGSAETCALIIQDPANAARILVTTTPFNFQRRLVKGIDFEATYRTGLESLFAGSNAALTLRGLATKYLKNIVDTGITTSAILNTVGVNGGQFSTPNWIFRFSATVDTPDYAISGVARGVSKGLYAANGIECAPGTCPTNRTAAEASAFPTYDNNRVKGTLYFDLNTTFKFDTFGDKRGEFFVNVTNVFNSTPLLLPETGLAANSTFSDLLGRTFRAGVRLNLR